MTEKDILDRQAMNDHREFFLILVGRFLHAFGGGAFALSRVTGYRVMRKQRKWGEVLTLGFPIDMFDRVRDRIRDAGGDIESIDEKTWMFRGLDGTPDASMVYESQPRATVAPTVETPLTVVKPSALQWLANAVRDFNLSVSTPMEAMLFVSDLQRRLLQEEKVSPAVQVSKGAESVRHPLVIACESSSS